MVADLAEASLPDRVGFLDLHRLMLAIVLGLVVGKPLGMTLFSRLAVRLGLVKPDAYTWRQLSGAGALAGIGFTMSLFIANEAFPSRADFAAAKVGIFIASIAAAGAGVAILWGGVAVNEPALPAREET